MDGTLLTPATPAPAAATTEPTGGTAEPAPAATPPVGGPIVPTEQDWTKALNSDGSFTQDAYQFGMPSHFKSLGAFHESHKELQRMKGAPGAEATPEQVQTFRNAHGVPEVANAETYGIELPAELSEIYKGDSIDRIVKVANDNAHLGHADMLKAVFGEFASLEMAGMQEHQANAEAAREVKLAESVKVLESDPNFTGDRKNAALQTSANALNSALSELGVDASSDEARELASNPLAVRILHHFGSKTTQDSMNLGSSTTDLRSGEEQANDIITNKNNPLYEDYHNGDPMAAKQVLSLMGRK